MPTAEELRQRAMTAVRAGNFAGARTLLERARVRAGDDPDQVALVGLSGAYVGAELDGSASAIRDCEQLLRADGLRPETRGRIWSQLGLLRMRSGDAAGAVAAYSAAVPLLADCPEHLGRALLNRGNVHLQLHDPTAAVADFGAAHEELLRAGAIEAAGKASHNVGYAYLLLGDLVAALRQMEDAARQLAPMSAVIRSVTEQDRAEVLLAAGRTREAVRALESAVAAYRSRRLPRFQAECEFVLARTLLHEDPERARVVARRAAARFERHGATAWAARARALVLVGDLLLGRRGPQLVARADALCVRLRADGHRRDADQLALHVARLRVGEGALADATGRLRRVRIDDRTPIGTRLLSQEVRAELAVARGHLRRARAHVRDGLADLHAWQGSFGSLDLQSTLVGHGTPLARIGLRLALTEGDPGLVLEWSERARALATRVTPVRPPPDPALAAALTELRLTGSGEPRREAELRERIRRQGWYGGGSNEVTEPATLDALQAGLAPLDGALVAHLALDGRLTALVVTPTDAEVLPLGDAKEARELLDRVAADLDLAASRTAGAMARAVRGSLRSNLAAAAARLVEPLLPVVGDRRLVLTPSALLAGTPWTLLPGLVGRPVTIPRSATTWLAGRMATPLRRVGLVAGPRVARAEEEVNRAARSWPGAEVLTGSNAAAVGVAELAGRVDVLHLAGHGRHSGEHPLFSAVELVDGPWFGYDIDLLERPPSVVVLSACELGRVSVRSGEEAVGMSAAWLHAGSRTVLSSPALVADAVACEALARWHGLVAGGAAPAEALATVGAENARSEEAPLPFLCFGAGW